MAGSSSYIAVLFSIFLVSSIGSSYADNNKPPSPFFQSIPRQGKEKVAKLHFYVQDLLSGPNQTVYEVARSSITSDSPTSFGQVLVVDDLLTAEPDINSQAVGRVQGTVTSSDLEIAAFTMNINFVFTWGICNGSTISILGRNEILRPSRELSVAGGTGMFRFARGYAVTDTHSYDVEKSYGVLEYTIYVTYLHIDLA